MILIKLDGVTPGDSQLKEYPSVDGWFSCTSCSYGIEREQKEGAKSGTDDITIGVGTLKEVEISKFVNAASPMLFLQSIAGGPLKKAIIAFVQTKGDATDDKSTVYPYLELSLAPAFVKTYKTDGSEDERPKESFTLWFRKVAVRYKSYSRNADNTYAYKETVARGWDQVLNQQFAPSDGDFK